MRDHEPEPLLIMVGFMDDQPTVGLPGRAHLDLGADVGDDRIQRAREGMPVLVEVLRDGHLRTTTLDVRGPRIAIAVAVGGWPTPVDSAEAPEDPDDRGDAELVVGQADSLAHRSSAP